MTEAEQKANDYCIELEKNGFSCGSCIIDCPNKDFMQNVVKVDDFFEEIKKAYIAAYSLGQASAKITCSYTGTEAQCLYFKSFNDYVNLNEKNKELKAQIEKMKCCGNCKHYIRPHEDSYVGEEECRFNISECGCDSCGKWELAE